MEKRDTKEMIHKILEYWYTIEFLGQDTFPNGREYLQKVENHKRSLKRREPIKTKQLIGFSDVTKAEIIPTVKREAQACKMNCWGNISVYIGTIKRECVIKALISKLDIIEDKRPEESVDRIAIASFQVTPDGNYVDNSLSLSPILWATNKIGHKMDNIATKISGDAYLSDVALYERILAPQKDDKKPYPIFLDDIDRLYDAIYAEYIRDILIENNEDTAIKKSYIGIYQLFVDEKVKEKYEDDTYAGLSRDYFSRDIKLLINENEKSRLSETLQDYILALHKKYIGEEIVKRNDVVPSKVSDMYKLQLNQIMRMRNAPIGKWPSKYMPALMQQMAINLLIGTEFQSEVNGKVFSVNGPPGTGKTTLLKEVVVNNIVERAALLAEYEKPDDAFIKENFQNGTKEENAYSTYVRRWYKLKNDKINDYSILVTSCNNAAVENISKELPVGKGILEDLSANEKEPQMLRTQLDEVRHLFDVTMSKDVENLFEWDAKKIGDANKAGEYADIYFTEYANELLDIKNAWGLIAAPLGKKSNKNNFYYKVISNLLRDFYQRNEMVENRIHKYQEARHIFVEQYKLVKKIQRQLDQYGEASEKRLQQIIEGQKKIERNQRLIMEADESITKLICNLKKIEDNIKPIKNKLAIVTSEKSALEEEIQNKESACQILEKELLEAREKVLAVQNSIGIFAKMFKTNKYQDAMKLAELHRNKGNDIERKIPASKSQIASDKEKLSVLCKEYTDVEVRYEKLNTIQKEVKKQIAAVSNQIKSYSQEIITIQKSMDAIQAEYDKLIADFTNATIDKAGVALDENYIQRIFSSDNEVSTKAQVDNPWVTQQYNREREKLFYYAIKLNKEFVLSSKACRDNFKSLGHYWGCLAGDDNEKIDFHENNEKGCVTALIQTLFLLVPVMSSTFASVSTFFKDVKQSDAVGLLIVDEAGQAQPQMALGALYRSRKAMIVGDPKQVEPVVTDELKLLKESYHEEIYNPYKEKNVSVQLCADLMNPFGTYMDNGSDNPDWVGCPLLVHRRCISPMYEISNTLSYNERMKQQTRMPKPEVEAKFIYEKSQWINIVGKEQGAKKHFVATQGQKVCEMLEIAFKRNESPDVYIISPFTTVVKGMRDYIQSYCRTHKDSCLHNALQDWIYDNIGTVHTFQGNEAKEVIFLLGCDDGAAGAIGWVNKNIVNVAVTRAKYRLYVIGDEKAWSNSECVSIMQRIIKEC